MSLDHSVLLPALRAGELYGVIRIETDGTRVLIGVRSTPSEVKDLLGEDLQSRLADLGFCCAPHMREHNLGEADLRAAIQDLGLDYDVDALPAPKPN